MRFGIQSRNKSRNAAFTLVEVLAALLFMAIVIPVAVQALRVASLAGTVAERKGQAMRVAEQVLNESILMTNYFGTTQRGEVREGAREFRWVLQSEVWAQMMTNQVPQITAGQQMAGSQPILDTYAASQVQMQLLTVEVFYPVQDREYSVKLSTLVNPVQ